MPAARLHDGFFQQRAGLGVFTDLATRLATPRLCALAGHPSRLGVWVTVEAETDGITHGFEGSNARTDASGRCFTLYKRGHLNGLEVGVSVASVALRGEPAGAPSAWNADGVATARRDLVPGDVLDGEGGFTVWGKLQPARDSRAMGGLPLGLAHDVRVLRAVKQGQFLSWGDVAMDTHTHAFRLRKEMEAAFGAWA